ncbi:transaldolase [Pseudoxanthomonas spadix]|uniref:transaldolase n=1 Tax=Pseudoxanthomonas spadix TaxID=415229 RepID=UPI000EFFC525|nr:transaldolase [Pseudoxanthomonas spadix]MBP3975320.1 transaldolase [Pseudoxanthomonas spadix]RMW95661.1 transaldolase [Pseudoxanthomonas spadix]
MTSPSKLQQLRELSVIVADTGDVEAIKRLKPVDCTTNPTLVKKALDLPVYAELIDEQTAWAKAQGKVNEERLAEVVDRLTIGVGTRLAGLIQGRVSTEVDADLAHDTAATVAKARKFIAMYAEQGVPRERILIKVAATWEGVEACRQLQAEGIDCNCTLIFNPTQALACAEAGAFLISPFVGRILDWYKAHGQAPASIDQDQGVKFVRGVYDTFKRRGIKTVVMGASFRSTAQIEALAGCDRLTISPDLLDQLDADHGPLPRKLFPAQAQVGSHPPVDAARFKADVQADPMAREKLADGIRVFAEDLKSLRKTIADRLA